MITAAHTRQVGFATTRSAAAYDRAAVDHLLGEVGRTLDALERGRTVGPGGTPLLMPRDVRTAPLPASRSAEGYPAAEVDAFRAQVVATLEEYVLRFSGGAAAGARGRPGSPSTAQPAAPSPAHTSPAQPTATQPPGAPASGGGYAPAAASATTPAPEPAPEPVDLTAAPDGLGAYDVLVQVQRARATLFGAARDVLVVRRPDGTELRVTGVEVVPGGAVVHVR
ncbi:hypothetical protein [Cellulomonas cellasea]|uniref:DivIVA domain-containing protein n=2 Tax=Cellulomonas cellasea TaxID=43670 RepID=A0A0A0B5C4_9CELL|nr:hypothetical protein [Cellulomonas cellasea]KGM02040.1 hypothetical protein Q760_15790 [Cellulomonas cellasea DSM 20118]GEA87607.1 hypothetical protein CCE01nite_15560 [Cellulomonas cellasea]